MKKRILSLLLTLVMVISLIPTTAWAADGTVTVTFSAQKDGAFLFTPQAVTVEDGIAETYGFSMPTTDHNSVAINAPTVFDAMVAVHKKKYGGAFTSETAKTYLDFNTSGTLTKAFGEAASASGFFVNHDMLNDGISGTYGTTGYMVNTARLNNNDIVDFWFYWEPSTYSYGDHFTYFTDSTKSVATGATFDLTLTGFPAMSAMGYTPTSTPIDGTDTDNTILAFYAIDESNSSTSLTDITPDADGKVTLSFNTAGTYIVTANGFVSGNPAIAPWCIVTVTGGGSGTPTTPPATTAHTLSSLSFNFNNKIDYPLTPAFNPSTHEYTISVPDKDGNNLTVIAAPTAADDPITAAWTKLNDNSSGTAILSTTGSASLTNCIKTGTTGNTVTLTVGEGDDADNYTVTVKRAPTLKSLSINGLNLNEAFAYNTLTYTADTGATSVAFSAEPYKNDYTIKYNGSDSPTVALNSGTNTVLITVTSGTASNTYTVTITRRATDTVRFTTDPTNAAVLVYDKLGNVVSANDDGSYSLLNGVAYSYAVTCKGYVSQYVASYTPTGNTTIDVTLTAAPASTRTDVGAAWKNFRNSDVNMGITNAKTPIADAVLKWNKKLGSGRSNAPSVQIIADNSLIVMMTGSPTLYKLDLNSGEILKQATMADKSSYGYTPPTYVDGLILCPLGNGTVQAFDARTLDSVWIYRDPLGGQALSPITCSDGYAYTGFWNAETASRNYVCLSLTDEDPTKTDEAKYATWSKTVSGGFYWAGSVVVGNALIVGSDDGASGSSGTSHLYALNKTTGKEISKLALTDLGDQRSSIAYDSATGRIYFTTKGGYLCSAAVSSSDGTLSDLKKMNMGAQSTSTPIVYKGYVYVCAGSGVVSEDIGKGSGHFIVAKANDLSKVSIVAMKAYPQCSPLLSTAYESSGYLCFYCTYNGTPGGISLIKVDTTTHQATLTELFTPDESMQQACICSIICGTDGTLYYKNDSGNVFAVSDNATIAAAVTAKINAIGEVTLDSEAKIAAARSAYDALTDAQKALVTNYNTLTAAETTLAGLKAAADRAAANAVISKINAVTTAIEGGDTDAIKSAIADAKAAYNSLTDAQKALVTNYDVLTAADSKYNPTGSKHEHTRRQPSTTGTASGTTTNTKDDVKSPATGDSSHMLLWLSGTLFSAAAIAVLTMKKKRSAR